MPPITLAATQFAWSWDLPQNGDKAEVLIRKAATLGAQVMKARARWR